MKSRSQDRAHKQNRQVRCSSGKEKNLLDTFFLEKLGAFPKQFFTSWNASAMTTKLKL